MSSGFESVPVVLLAGGLGTRLREETELRPKPMIEVGGHPLLWHVMKIYSSFGFNEFVICLGYKGEVIKDFFLNYRARQGGVSIDLTTGLYEMHQPDASERWKVHLLETGFSTMTGGRIKRASAFLGPRRFLATYGDGVADINIKSLLDFHIQAKGVATISAVRPPSRFGGLNLEDGKVRHFDEKPALGEGWINGGFMVFEPEISNYIDDDNSVLERAPFERLAQGDLMSAFKHNGFWQCMDTIRDLNYLREQWDCGTPAWKVW